MPFGTDGGLLAGVVQSTVDDGAPLSVGLERLADSMRTVAQRAAEADARRLPVKLLFPLAVCVLPAFVVLTLVPLLASSMRGLSW